MNPSFFIPDHYKNTQAPAQGSVSALSPINDYFGKSKNLRAQSPRVNQRQAKKMINSLDYKRNSDYSLNVNNNSTAHEYKKQTLFSDYKNLKHYAIQKLSKQVSSNSVSSKDQLFLKVPGNKGSGN